jgi:hypothetical protein
MGTPESLAQAVWDENAIRKLVIGFCLGMDTRDAGLFRKAWAEEVELNLRTTAADVIPLTGPRAADDYTRDVIGLLSGFTATQHQSTNHYIEVDGDTATCTCYVYAVHYLRQDGPGQDGTEHWLTAGSRYELTARRLPGLGWRFTAFRLTPIFRQGEQGIWGLVRAKPQLGRQCHARGTRPTRSP